MTTIGDLTLNDIGKTRVRTEYQGATIEGLITSLDLAIDTQVQVAWGGERKATHCSVLVDMQLGQIQLLELRRDHPCEVIV